jgi:hypothetical protein
MGNDLRVEFDTHLFGAQMSVLALRQMKRCLDNASEIGVHFDEHVSSFAAITAFLDTYGSAGVTHIRDAIEHEADRIAGVNLHGRSRYDGPPIVSSTGFSTKTGRLTSIRVLDEDFDIAEVIATGLALDEPLTQLGTEVWTEVHASTKDDEAHPELRD